MKEKEEIKSFSEAESNHSEREKRGEGMKFRKKPVVIEAEQFFANTLQGWPSGMYRDGDGVFLIDTLEGPLRVSDGDWIITGIQGERYPCKPDIFEATYEAVE